MNESKQTCQTCGKAYPQSLNHLTYPACSLYLLQLGLPEKDSPSLLLGTTHSRFGSLSGKSSVHHAALERQGVITKFDDYEILHEVARGGMGVVFRARQISLQRDVAVKMILAGQLATPELVQRFCREAEAAAKLRHPGIVRIYEIGEFESQHYFSMEFIEGASLAECMGEFCLRDDLPRSEHKMKEKAIADLMLKVARALDFAHQHGVLHRDMKPSNILVDEQGQPHLTDFGLAKLTGAEKSGLTIANAVLGTPGYLAPEQVEGQFDRVTTATDVYGLGATLYELLTGQPPFAGASAFETMWMAVHQDIKPPRAINPSIPQDLETIALRCLEKRPEQRYGSASVVADELERFLQNEPIQARPVSQLEYMIRLTRRNPRMSALIGALLLTFLVGCGVSMWQRNRAERSNLALLESVEHLEWNAIDAMLTQGESSRALASVASLIRNNPNDKNAAMFAMSLMESTPFPVPSSPTFQHSNRSEIKIARVSPDGKRVITGSVDGTAQLWDAEKATPILEPFEHGGVVTWAAFHPTEKVVVTASKDGFVRAWSLSDGSPLWEPFAADEAVQKVQFSQDGKLLLVETKHKAAIIDSSSGKARFDARHIVGAIVECHFVLNDEAFFVAEENGEKSCIWVWNTNDGTEVLRKKISPFLHVDLANDLTKILFVDSKRHFWLADLPDMATRTKLGAEVEDIEFTSFHPAGDFFCTLSGKQTSQLWSTKSGLPVSAELPHYYLLAGVSFVDSGNRLLTWGDDALIQFWEVPSGRKVCEPLRHMHRVTFADFARRGTQDLILATLRHQKPAPSVTMTGSAQMSAIPNKEPKNVRKIGFDSAAFDGACFSPDGSVVALGHTSHEVRLHDTRTGELIGAPIAVGGNAWGIMFSKDSKKLIVTTANGLVQCYSVEDGMQLHETIDVHATIQPAEISSDGTFFVTGSTDGIVRIFALDTFTLMHEMKHGSEINAVAISPNGREVVSAGEDHVLRVWDVETGVQLRELTGHTNEVMMVTYSPDGEQLLTASLDFTARIWNAKNGSLVHKLSHQGEVLDIAITPDGSWIATGSRDRTAVIWNAKNGKPIINGLLHAQGVRNVQFSPDGTQLLTSSFDGLRLWDVATGHPLTVTIKDPLSGGTGFQSTSGRGGFSPDGKLVVRSADSYEALLWQFSTPTSHTPTWFADFLEAVAGQKISTETRRPEAVEPERFLNLKHQILHSSSQDSYTTWAKNWLQ